MGELRLALEPLQCFARRPGLRALWPLLGLGLIAGPGVFGEKRAAELPHPFSAGALTLPQHPQRRSLQHLAQERGGGDAGGERAEGEASREQPEAR